MHSVLICDDDELLHEAIGDHLQAEGYAVLTVEDGGAALQAIDEALPDVVVLDLHMPRVDGFTVLRRVRELHASLPVIVMTGHGGISSAIEATKLGASAYLCKPFDPNELSLHLQRALHPPHADDELRTLDS